MKILVNRGGAMGDVVTTTPVIARLRKEHPDAIIDITTHAGAVYEGPGYKNPHIDNVNKPGGPYDCEINLDMVHEQDRGTHPIDLFMEHVFKDRNGPNDCHFPIDPVPPIAGGLGGVNWNAAVCLHANSSWQNRTLPTEFWQALTTKICAAGFQVILLGTSIDQRVFVDKVIDTIGKLNLYQQAAAMHHSRVAICGPAGIEQLAWTTDAPIVAFVTTTPLHCATPWRHGEFGWNWHYLITDLECRGCAAAVKGTTYVGCHRGDFACTRSFSADEAWKMVKKAIIEDRRGPP